jgi:hypothetical protein
VDEFQHFATDSFATILSEARKYALNLTVANQYIAQMSPEVKDAVFGNVGSMIAFRMGADDARGMQRYFEPRFEEYDLVHMHNRHFVVNMTIQGEKTPAFSAFTIDLPPHETDETANIIEHSRAEYALHLTSVEDHIRKNYIVESKKPSPAPPKPAAPKPTVKSVDNDNEAKPASMPKKEPEAQVPAEKKISNPVRGVAVGKVAVTTQKRKRTRRRKKSAASNSKPTPKTLASDTEHIIFSR